MRSREMSAKRSHGPTVSVQFQHLIHQPTWNKSSHGKFANIRALPSPPSRLHTGQGDKEPSQTGCASVLAAISCCSRDIRFTPKGTFVGSVEMVAKCQ